MFTELFAYDPAAPSQLLGKWRISSQLESELQPLRVGVVEDPIGKTVGRITVQEGDGLAVANEAMLQARHYICNSEGSRAAAVERAGGIVPSERADSFKIGKSCDASPFFKIEARPLGERVRFFAQVTTGTACDRPPTVKRTKICQRDLPRESWIRVQVRLNPAHDTSGQVDIWLNGSFCGSYQGPMADRDYGVRRNGTPFINAQPRFGIYRDWRAETQTIYFDKIMFWNADPSGHPEWGVSPPPG